MAAHKKAEDLLTKHIDELHALAKALLDYEILDGEQIDQVLKGEPIDSIAFTGDATKTEKRKTSAKPKKKKVTSAKKNDEREKPL